jgi:hypothetical protein
MDPDDLDVLGDLGSDGADLAVNSPDIQIAVAPSSFPLDGNYTADPVTIPYNPGGFEVSSYGADSTLATLANQSAIPTGTEDAIAYSANLEGTPTYTNGVAATDLTNTTDGGPVDANSAGTQATNASAGLPNPYLHGIVDAVTGLTARLLTGAVKPVANKNSIAQRTPAPLPATQDQAGGPMRAGRSSFQAEVAQIEAGKMSPAILALGVGAIALLFYGVA